MATRFGEGELKLPTRSHTITWLESVRDPSELRTLAGLEYLRRLIDDGTSSPMWALMGFRAVRFELGLAVFEGAPQEFHYNGVGIVHGGFAASLLDSALGCSVHTTMKPGFCSTTIELKVNYVRPLTSQTGLVTASDARSTSVPALRPPKRG